MATPPTIQFNQFITTSGDPSGARHLETASGWIKKLDTSSTGVLEFGTVNNTTSKVSTTTYAVVPFVSAMNDASTLTDFRFWLPTQNAISGGTYTFNQQVSGTFVSGINLTDASGSFTSTSLPASQNINRQDGFATVSGANSDSETLQYVYLSITVDTDVDNGVYGGSAGTIRYRLTYDFV